jgi:hypothetical protein
MIPVAISQVQPLSGSLFQIQSHTVPHLSATIVILVQDFLMDAQNTHRMQ